MKAIIIARVSTEEQKEAGNSLPAQVARLERHCQSRGYQVIKIFSFDESAYKNKRSEFDRILDYILQQKEKLAVCLDTVDRLSRNIFDKRISALYQKALNDEIELHFAKDNQIINSKISATQQFQFNISLGLAKYYSDAISDNVKRANEQKLRKGEWTAKAPYGYKNVTLPDDKKDIIVDEHAAYIVKKSFEFYATGVYSFKTLQEKMFREFGITRATGFIDKVFNNHFYYGIMIVKGKSYPHRYPTLISKDLFNQVQAIKNGLNKKQFKYAGYQYLYRGLLRCADCGMAITPERHKGHIYYHCTQYNGKHGAKWLREEKITEQLSSVFRRMHVPPNILQQITGVLNEVHKQKVEFQTRQYDLLTSQRKTLTSRLDKLYVDKLDGKISADKYEQFYEQFRSELDDVDARLASLQEAEDNYYATAKCILNLASRAHELFTGSEVDEKRQLIGLVLSNLKVECENVVYNVQKPFDLIIKCSDEQLWRP